MSSTSRSPFAAALGAALLAASPAAAVTQVEPIARLVLEGGYDSNLLYDGDSAGRAARVSPDVGLRVRDHLYDLTATYGGDWLHYPSLSSDRIWNQRGVLSVEATPSRRLELRSSARISYAYDPLGLAQAGVFRAGRDSALMVQGGGRVDWDATSRVILALALTERVVRFEGHTGGAMHAPSMDLLWRKGRRLAVGGAYAFTAFQDFRDDRTDLAFANAVRARARYRVTRQVEADAFAGPALWRGPEGVAIVPEVGAEVRVTSRWWDLRATAGHRLGIGSTASPGLVDSIEVGGVRRFGRRWELRGDAGLWNSGEAPRGRNANVGYAMSGEVGMAMGGGTRIAAAAGHLARLDDTSAALRRTTVGLRLGWELPVR